MNIIPLEDFSDGRLDLYARTNEIQLKRYYEPNGGLFVAESPNVIRRALDAGCRPLSVLTEERHLEGQKELLEDCGDIPVYVAPIAVLSQLTGYMLTSGMVSAMVRPAPLDPQEVIKGCRRIAVLEDVMNPANLGAIFRSAAALDMDAVLLSPGCSDPLYRRAVRVSMGTVFQIPWAYFPQKEGWPKSGIDFLKSHGYVNVAMALRHDTVSIADPRLRKVEKMAVFLGSEGPGLREETIDLCDYTVRIPMGHGVDSLNVAAASAVAFWELGRRDL